MKKLGLTLFTSVVILSIIFVFSADKANSRPQYNKEFTARFVKPDSADANEKALADACGQAKCSVCHEGDTKKNRNAFGRELAKLLHNEKDKAKIDEAFDTVLQMKSDPKDPNSPTFGELMKQGKLPATQ